MLLFASLCIVAVVTAKVVFPKHKEEPAKAPEEKTEGEEPPEP